MTGFNEIRLICNTHYVGDAITRQELINKVSMNLSHSTIDHYRRMLTVLGYLGENSLGRYVLLKRIPNISSSSIRREYDIRIQENSKK